MSVTEGTRLQGDIENSGKTFAFSTFTARYRYVIYAWVGVKNFGFTEKQKNIEQGSTKMKELHVCIMRVQKKMAAWRSEVP